MKSPKEFIRMDGLFVQMTLMRYFRCKEDGLLFTALDRKLERRSEIKIYFDYFNLNHVEELLKL